MRFRGTLRAVRFDLSDYQRALHAHMVREIQDAAKAWLQAALSPIPVWSGASVATFLKLSATVSFPLGVSPQAGVSGRIALGRRESDGELNLGEGGEYTFRYETELAHLIWNEFHNANINPDPTLFGRLLNPGPYEFQAAGLRVFLKLAGGARLPDVRRSQRQVSYKV